MPRGEVVSTLYQPKNEILSLRYLPVLKQIGRKIAVCNRQTAITVKFVLRSLKILTQIKYSGKYSYQKLRCSPKKN